MGVGQNMARFKDMIIRLGLVALSVGAAGPAFSGVSLPGPSTDRRLDRVKPIVIVVNDRITANLDEVPLPKVLEAIARASGARIVLHGAIDETVSADIEGLSIEEGLKRFLRGRNAVFYYKSNSTEPGNTSGWSLSEVQIFGLNGESSMDLVTSFDFGAEAVTNLAKGRETRSAIETPRDPVIDGLAKQLLESSDGEARRDAVRELGQVDDPDVIEPLSEALLKDADDSVRIAAASALGKTWDEGAVAPLALSALHDDSEEVREAAVRALGTTWSEDAVSTLLMVLSSDGDAMVREQAARALAQTAGSEAVDALIQALNHDPRWFVRDAAASALGTIGGGEALDALAMAAVDDPDGWVKETAADSAARPSK
jgi:hypothetical protein